MYLYFKGHTYEVVTQAMSWEEARQYAASEFGYLVRIQSKAEDEAIYNYLVEQSKTWNVHYTAPDGGGAEYVWLGGNDIETEGKWQWSDGASLTYENWGYGGEPDNFENQDAMAMGLEPWPRPRGGLGNAGQWNDIDVSNRLYFIIERDGLYGTSGADLITGTKGKDWISTFGGDDVIYGGKGKDRIRGGDGADEIFGGGGADTFVYWYASESTATATDMIHDFSRRQGDKIELVEVMEGDGTFIGKKKFTGNGPEVRYEKGADWTTILVDVDGDKTADMVIDLVGAINLRASDFIL